MAFKLETPDLLAGETKRLIIEVQDVDGQPLVPQTLTLLIRRPDGTEENFALNSFSSPSDGTYELAYTFTQEGRYEFELEATDALGSVKKERFIVGVA